MNVFQTVASTVCHHPMCCRIQLHQQFPMCRIKSVDQELRRPVKNILNSQQFIFHRVLSMEDQLDYRNSHTWYALLIRLYVVRFD